MGIPSISVINILTIISESVGAIGAIGSIRMVVISVILVVIAIGTIRPVLRLSGTRVLFLVGIMFSLSQRLCLMWCGRAIAIG